MLHKFTQVHDSEQAVVFIGNLDGPLPHCRTALERVPEKGSAIIDRYLTSCFQVCDCRALRVFDDLATE